MVLIRAVSSCYSKNLNSTFNCVLNVKMSSKDKPKAAKFRKIESFFNKPAVAVTDANDSRSAAAHVERASIIRASLATAGSTSTRRRRVVGHPLPTV